MLGALTVTLRVALAEATNPGIVVLTDATPTPVGMNATPPAPTDVGLDDAPGAICTVTGDALSGSVTRSPTPTSSLESVAVTAVPPILIAWTGEIPFPFGTPIRA